MIWNTQLKVAREAMKKARLDASQIAALGVTNQRETTVLWERDTGRPVDNAIVWQSRQSADICRELQAEGLEDIFRKKTGLMLDAYFSGTKIKYLLDKHDGLRERAAKGEILFGKLRPYFHKVGVAPIDGVCSTDIVVVVPSREAWFALVLGHVSSKAFVDYTNAGSTGTKMPRTSWDQMGQYPIAVPPETIAEALSMQSRPVVARITASVHESHTLAAVRDALLSKLLSGDIRIRDPNRFLKELS